MSTQTLPATRDGIFAVTSSMWDSNGSFRVTIVDLRDNADEIVPPEVLARERRRIRNLARRVDRMDEVRWVRVDHVGHTIHEGRKHIEYRLTASRLEPMYR